MPRSYFDVTDSQGYCRDGEGSDLVDLATARKECGRLLPNIARDQSSDGDLHVITCDVRDQAGSIVYRGELTYRGILGPASEARAS